MARRSRWLVIIFGVLPLSVSAGIGGTTAEASGAGASGSAPDVFFSLPSTTSHTVELWTWSGRRAGQFHTGPVAECCTTVSASPDGHRLQVWHGRGAEIVNDTGKRLGRVSAVGTWSDDNQHLCSLQLTQPARALLGGSGRLQLERAGHSGHLVRIVPGVFGPHADSAVGWCSTLHDQAVIFFNEMGLNRRVEVVQLSTGKILHPLWEQDRVTGWVAVSGDGRYAVAIGSIGGGEVVDTATGKVVASVPVQPVGLSWNGHVVVGLSISTAQEVAVDWANGKTLWTSNMAISTGPRPMPNAVLAEEPGSDTLAVVVTNTPTDNPPTASLWLLGATMKPKLLSTQVQEGAV